MASQRTGRKHEYAQSQGRGHEHLDEQPLGLVRTEAELDAYGEGARSEAVQDGRSDDASNHLRNRYHCASVSVFHETEAQVAAAGR